MSYAGELSALLTAVMWTGSALAFAAATTRVGSVYVNVIRLAAAVVLLVATVAVGRISIALSFTQIGYLAASGLVGFVFGDTFLFKSYEYNSARISTVVMSAAPAMAALLAFLLLGEKLSLLSIFGMVVTLTGITIVVMEKREESTHHVPVSMTGVLYAFLGALGQAGGLVLAKQAFVLGSINGFLATLIRATAGTLVLAPMNYYAGRFSNPVEVFVKDRSALHFTLLGAFLGPFLGVTFSLIAVSMTNVAIAATLMATAPLMVPVAVGVKVTCNVHFPLAATLAPQGVVPPGVAA